MTQDIIKDFAGRDVDCSGDVWRLNVPGDAMDLNWQQLDSLPAEIIVAAKAYVKHKISTWGPPSVAGFFYMLTRLSRCHSLKDAYAGQLTFRAFEELRSDKRAHGPDLTRFRGWYGWCAINEYSAFDSSVFNALATVKIGADPHGRVARKKKLDQGPLTDGERDDLLRKTFGAADLGLRERVAILLAMAFGANSGPLTLLRVDDYQVKSSGGTIYYFIRIPRHKKGFSHERADFRTRQVDSTIAPYLERLIAENRRRASVIWKRHTGLDLPADVGIPIFMGDSVNTTLTAPMREYSLHMAAREFTEMLQETAYRVKGRSRSGIELSLNTRRLRSTFATNLIVDGYPKAHVADALDHSNTKSVDRYEFQNHRLVESLDARIGQRISVVAKAFLGQIGSEPHPVASGSRAISYFDRTSDRPMELGSCGSNEPCGLPTPVACYSCQHFRVGLDAPHDRFLNQLESERQQRRDSAKHPRIVLLHQTTIQAIQEVIEASNAARAAR
ncbi:site-specific integrase [Tardiphaga sp. OK245]|uniref:site-specific integrase n=1 Tax=Tardiphaga sp. OK245 TaxID=1855306 RepID=UPI0008A7D06E|nr:site-specific integrase [Tardiphaga sp. OK245]SEH87736.1 Phage integrase family protein [Tardiphaga sp. OK245]